MDVQIREIIEGVSNTYGDGFFQSITEHLAKVIQADYTFIARLDADAYVSRTISMVAKGERGDNMAYSLTGTPCANVAENTVCCYPENVVKYFPDDHLLIEMGIEAYLGTPLLNSKGEVMGLIVALYESPLEDDELAKTLFQVFSGRISAEIERREYENQLESLNNDLENKIDERTRELSHTMENLKSAQDKLIESEKNAALGNLVAGVAHEVNTPLGIAITAWSVMQDRFKQLCNKIDSDELSIQDMDDYRADVGQSLSLQETNLDRAKELVENFKKTAADQHELELEKVDLPRYYKQVMSTLHSLLKKKNVVVKQSGVSSLNCTTYPGVHAQILTNLISNSVAHGFDSRDGNEVSIDISELEDGRISIRYQDNGIGLNEEGEKKVFEPFYTTARKEGGTGLGMSIVHSLVTQSLDGEVKIEPNTRGFNFAYTFSSR